jgi:F-box-like
MARGNWQKRVERTDARRKEAKEKKHRSDEKRVFKAMAHDLLGFLDRQIDTLRQRSSVDSTRGLWEIHLWTDSMPSTIPFFLATEDSGGKYNRKTRSASMDDSNAVLSNERSHGRKARGRSGSFQQEEKKVHPRCNQGEATASDECHATGPLLCRSHFFTGKCLDPQKGGKKGGCRCTHYNNKQFKTLAAVLIGSKQIEGESKQRTALEMAEGACEANTSQEVIDAEAGAMEMVYYLSLPVASTIFDKVVDEDVGDQADNTISQTVMAKLIENQLGIGSIIYLAISSPSRHALLYDRNQNGLVVMDFTIGGSTDGKESNSQTPNAEKLPVSILEHILLYLEAPAVASGSLVCTSWHREISHASPNLWRALLVQRSWPLPLHVLEDDSAPSLPESSRNLASILRDEFIKHYSVYRDMKAIQNAMTGLLTRKACEQREMTYQAFSTRRNAPQAPNNCVSVEIWGPNQVLAAYSNDCTLRLFQALPRGGNHHNRSNLGRRIYNEKLCREMVCLSIDPYSHTKKKSSFMEAMGLDEDVVGCLLSVSDESSDYKTTHILVILSRDDVLVVNSRTDITGRISEPEGALQVIDIETAVLNYVLSLDQVDHRLLQLNDFLALGGDSNDIEFIVSPTMAACGYGRFMVEVAV